MAKNNSWERNFAPETVKYMKASKRFADAARRLDYSGGLPAALENAESAYKIVKDGGEREIFLIQKLIESAGAIVTDIKKRMNQ